MSNQFSSAVNVYINSTGIEGSSQFLNTTMSLSVRLLTKNICYKIKFPKCLVGMLVDQSSRVHETFGACLS